MAKVIIHHKEIEYNSELEYGLYFAGEMGFQNYNIMYLDKSAVLLNKMPEDKVIEQAKLLKTTAEIQLAWQSTPGIIGSPFLVSSNKSVPIDDVRKNIENTKLFAEDLIKVLSGD